MEVEVTEIFSPQAGKRPANFIVLKYFLLGMLFSNAIESILIVPKTLSLMEDNEEELEKLARIYEEHDAFKTQLHEYSKVTKKVIHEEKENFNVMVGNEEKEGPQHHESSTQQHKKTKKKHHTIKFAEEEGPLGGAANEKMIEYMLLIYGVLTCSLGIFAVFKEQDKLLMIFIGIVGLGLIVLFFSGLTLIVFMAILNDVIIGIVSYKFLQMMTQPVAPDYVYGVPGTGVFPEAAYTVDLNEPSAYGIQQQ
jgi:hypothetical protein